MRKIDWLRGLGSISIYGFAGLVLWPAPPWGYLVAGLAVVRTVLLFRLWRASRPEGD